MSLYTSQCVSTLLCLISLALYVTATGSQSESSIESQDPAPSPLLQESRLVHLLRRRSTEPEMMAPPNYYASRLSDILRFVFYIYVIGNKHIQGLWLISVSTRD